MLIFLISLALILIPCFIYYFIYSDIFPESLKINIGKLKVEIKNKEKHDMH